MRKTLVIQSIRKLLFIGVTAVLVIPILFLFGQALQVNNAWQDLLKDWFTPYLLSSLFLCLASGTIAVCIAIPSALFISFYKFPFSKYLEWLLVLPLAIPTYIMALSYNELADVTSSFGLLLFKVTGSEIKSFWGLSLVMAFCLYPYIYLPLKTYLKTYGASYLEATKTLGSSRLKSLFRVILPLCTTAIAGGLILMCMEVLNDYGAAKYYGVQTLSTGIFKTWFGLGKLSFAAFLATALLLVVLLLNYVANRLSKSKASTIKYQQNYIQSTPSIVMQVFALLFCASVFTICFMLPLGQILGDAWQYFPKTDFSVYLSTITNSLAVALIAGLIILALAHWTLFEKQVNTSKIGKMLFYASQNAYALPGAVIAMAILVPYLLLQNFLQVEMGIILNLLNSSIFLLVLATSIRFIVIGIKPLNSGYAALSNNLASAAQSLGQTKWQTFYKVYWPNLRPYTLSAAILVFVDLLKELPITLILRPFNFNTIASKTFELAADELVAQSGVYSILIVLTGSVALYLLNFLKS